MAVRKRAPQTVAQKVKSAEEKIERAFTVMWDELPLWQQDNHYILSGYRPEFLSFKKCFISLGYLHNETGTSLPPAPNSPSPPPPPPPPPRTRLTSPVNIYSHLLPALSIPYLALLLYTLYHPPSTANLLAFSTFLLSAAACLGMSATYHTISCHSHEVAKLGNKLDYLGIVILIMGSFIPSVYYGFYCDSTLMWVYWSMIALLGAGCAVVSTVPSFRTPAWRPFRAAMFVAMGGSSVVPVLHGLRLYGWADLEERMGLSWMLAEGALYVTGAGLYAARVPEKWAPGRFDIWGSSHQIFHFLVVAAAACHLVGLVKSAAFLEGKTVEGLCAGM
ncbi:uncharacterized protein H6S33_006725 [Morchella sextelata]|uniref:uncharacterized protein n=1 Tax=Morchella sextelata TaxID=1174677 RepID=UPI001D044817|nr:uncharacterized protein H6S33_006725 [Morchella sextelata]KAH0604348.1 hypothetical protein H6S33_006725 [Morchella sextelata]